MKRLMVLFVMFIAVAAALAVVLGADAAVAAAANETANVIISQVLYNPAGSESGGEAVELYNPAASSVNISGWVLATETSPTDAIIPPSAVICGGCYYLVADLNWSNAKDNSSWPYADFEEAVTLANTDAGVALKDSNGIIADAVGWGNPVNIGAGLFEGIPHIGSSGGNALVRRTVNGSYLDTNNNSNDFIEAMPNFHNSSSSVSKTASANAEIQIMIIVSGSGPAVSTLNILADDDSFLPGNQVSPVPNKNKTMAVEAVIADDNGASDIASVILTFNSANLTAAMAKKSDINATAAIYSASFNLSSHFPAGNYTITATATDNSGFSANSSASFEYLTMTAVEVDASSITFFASPGSMYEVIGDESSSTATNITVLNAGNVQLDFDLWSTNFSSGSSTIIEASKLQYTFNGNYNNASFAGNMTNAKARKDINLNPSSTAGLSLRLNLPLATSPGNYSGKISLVAVNS
ncbi:lamin tail domain-containing protein [Candidatus Woesearchaeota archaeon]|nr:lamin tail domain-containing protein [Candidatus Woesearchaeota archaeon]